MTRMSHDLVNGSYPRTRMRRNRAQAWSRRLVAEHEISVSDLIWPVFIIDGEDTRVPVAAMPGVERYSIDILIEEARIALSLGIPALALFPVLTAAEKSEDAAEATNPDNLLCRAVRALKQAVPEIGLICDIALDPYTIHGHDGLMQDGVILNDETIAVLCEQARVLAEAGCDMVAPSDMMDGRIGVIRDHLDAHGFEHVQILAYSAKYASSFYGPFRDAVNSGGFLKGDKKTYQMDAANGREAEREALLDKAEGADILMVKPGLPYLDILYRVKQAAQMPVFVYHVSGEYAMLKAAAANGWLDYDKTLMESLLAFKRAGADAILTYAARDAARLMQQTS